VKGYTINCVITEKEDSVEYQKALRGYEIFLWCTTLLPLARIIYRHVQRQEELRGVLTGPSYEIFYGELLSPCTCGKMNIVEYPEALHGYEIVLR